MSVPRRPASRIGAMLILAVKTVWTQWMGVGVAILAILGTLGTAAAYFVKVVRPKYPPRGARRG